MRDAVRRRWRSERGANSVEFVLYTPLMFLIIFLIVQFALTWHANQVASATAREAARLARGSHSQSHAETGAQAFLDAVGRHNLQNADIDVIIIGDDTVRATVTGRSREILPGMSPRVEQVIEGPLERFIPDW